MKLQGRKKFYDAPESPSKRVTWNPQQKEKEIQFTQDILSQSIELSSNNIQNQIKQQQIIQNKCQDLLSNKKKLMSLLADNNIEFSSLNGNEYQATVKLVNVNSKIDDKSSPQLSISKVTSQQGYYAEKDKQTANLVQLNKANKQPFISATLTDIKQQELADNNNYNLMSQIGIDSSVDQNERFLRFMDDKYNSIQADINNAEQLLTIHNTNLNIKQLRDLHQQAMNTHKKLASIFLRSPKEFRIKAIAYLKPIQNTIAEGNYQNIRKDSDLEILYSLLQKLLIDNCDAQTMEEFVEEQIKLQAVSQLHSSTSSASNQANNLTQSQSTPKRNSKKFSVEENELRNGGSFRSGSMKKSQNSSKKLIILQQTPRSSSLGKDKTRQSQNNKSFLLRNQNLNYSQSQIKDEANRSYSSNKKHDNRQNSQNNKKQCQLLNKSLNHNKQDMTIQNIKNKKIFYEMNDSNRNSNQYEKRQSNNSLNLNTISKSCSFIKDASQQNKGYSSNNIDQNHTITINEKQKKYQVKNNLNNSSVSSYSLKNESNLTLDTFYGKTPKLSNPSNLSMSNFNSSSTPKGYSSQSTTNQNLGHFDFSNVLRNSNNRSLSNKNQRSVGSVMNSFFSTRINNKQQATPKSAGNKEERRNSRSLSPSKCKSNKLIEQNEKLGNSVSNFDDSPSSRKLMKASDIQKQYDISRSSSPSKKKLVATQSTRRILKHSDIQQEYAKILNNNFSTLKLSKNKTSSLGQVNERIIQEEFSKSLQILNQNFHLLGTEELMVYYDFIKNKAQVLQKQFMKKVYLA